MLLPLDVIFELMQDFWSVYTSSSSSNVLCLFVQQNFPGIEPVSHITYNDWQFVVGKYKEKTEKEKEK